MFWFRNKSSSTFIIDWDLVMVIQLGQINCFSLLPVPYDITNHEEPVPYAIRYQYLMAPYDKVPVPYDKVPVPYDKVPVPYQVELPRYCRIPLSHYKMFSYTVDF